MARGCKKETRTLDEQLQAVIGEIATYEEKLKELRRRKKEIEQKITEDKKEALYRAVMESGKSLDEVLAGLSNQ
nr:flagellar export protein FliJ [uncultured Blautia sp.]